MRPLAATFVVLVGLVGCGQSGSSTAPKAAAVDPAKPVADLLAPVLFQEYERNALAADGKYLGKPVRVTGPVGAVQKDAQGRYYVGLMVVASTGATPQALARMTPQQQKWVREGYPPNVICYVDPAKQDAFTGARKDAQFSIVGVVSGARKDPDVWQGLVVTLDQCAPAP